jgi:hypothetical protein
MNKGRSGQPSADGAVFFVKFGSLSTMSIWLPLLGYPLPVFTGVFNLI